MPMTTASGALLTTLSKAFDCLFHDLLIAKLHAYDLDISSLNLLQNYLSSINEKLVDTFLVPGNIFYLE